MNKKDYSVLYLILSFIFWLLTVSWVVVIFYFSSENGSESSQTSSMFIEFINKIFTDLPLNDTIVRKAGHISEFLLLTILSYFSIYFTNKVSKSSSYSESPIKILKSDNEMIIIFTLWFCLLNAIFDEYHQLFVSGRDGNIIDVLIDSIGIVIVLLICRLVFSLSLSAKGRKEVRYS